MIQCPHCGAMVEEQSVFCPLCFTTLQAQTARRNRRSTASSQQAFAQPPAAPPMEAYPLRQTPTPPVQGYPPQQFSGPPMQGYPSRQSPEPPAQGYPPQQQSGSWGYVPQRQTQRNAPQGFDRGYRARTDLSRRTPEEQAMLQRAEKAALPTWLVASLALTLIACMALLAGVMLMRADLHSMQESKERVYRSTVSKHPRDYRETVERYAERYNLQPAYVMAIVLNESSFDERAESRVGARGLMQVMENTGSWIAGRLNISDYSFDMLWDPEINVRFGCWYLNYLSKMFDGDPILVTCAYHAGQGNVSVWLRNPDYSPDGAHIDIDHIPTSDTKAYAERVVRDYAIYDALYYRTFNSGDTAIDDPAADSGAPR